MTVLEGSPARLLLRHLRGAEQVGRSETASSAKSIWAKYFGANWTHEISQCVLLTQRYDDGITLRPLGELLIGSLNAKWETFAYDVSPYEHILTLQAQLDETSPNDLFRIADSDELVSAFAQLLELLDEVPLVEPDDLIVGQMRSAVQEILRAAQSGSRTTSDLTGPCLRLLERLSVLQDRTKRSGENGEEMRQWLIRANSGLQTAAAICALVGFAPFAGLLGPTHHQVEITAVSCATTIEIDLTPKALMPGPEPSSEPAALEPSTSGDPVDQSGPT